MRRARAPLIVAIAFFAQWLPWAINPKGLEFYYYFYPSIVCLGPALALVARGAASRPWRDAFVWATLAASAAMFVYFLPILVSGDRRRAQPPSRRASGCRLGDERERQNFAAAAPGFARVVAAFFIGGFAIFELLYCVQPLLPEFAREFHLAPASASLAVSVSTVAMACTLFLAGFAAERLGASR